VEDLNNTVPNAYLRSERLINRIYEQLNCHELSLDEKVHLWTLVYKVHLKHQKNFPDSSIKLDIVDTKEIYI
jgi:hypothetical protein